MGVKVTLKRRTKGQNMGTRRQSRPSLGFIILRHVNSRETNLYWQEAYECIRKFYPENRIVIIDDNSNPDYVTEQQMYKTKVIHSEFPGRGELLPYYYYARNKWFDTALILHDSVFINKYTDLSVDKYKILWEFEHKWDKPRNEVRLISALKNNEELLKFHANKDLWKGCFGAMSIIEYKYIKMIDDKHDLSRLIPLITKRLNRMTFERVFACLVQAYHKKTTLLGNIHNYTKWGYTFYKYLQEHDKCYMKMPLIKVWTGR